ncbi:MAG TPA: alpha/beta fold hydrolase, partial [Polyangia bacterium]|nr:alpha/beta fold hydrolase [Polyangia bacterium]
MSGSPLAATVLLKGLIVATGGGAEIGRQSYQDDGRTLRSRIALAGQSFEVAISRPDHKVTVTEGGATVTRDVPAGAIVLENGDWQAYALAAEQFPDARAPIAVKVLVPGQGRLLDATIRVTAGADKTRRVVVSIPPLTVEAEVAANGAVTRVAVPLQGIEARSVDGTPAPEAPRAPTAAEAHRPPPPGVVEEPIAVDRGGVELRGVLWRPAHAKAKPPLALIVAGSGPVDRDGNAGTALRTDCYRMLAEALAEDGVASLRFDKRGVGASDPVKEDGVTVGDFVDDAAALAAEARRERRFSKLTLVGHSEGALIALLLAAKVPVDALVLLAGAGRPLWQVLHEQLARTGQLDAIADEILTALRDGKPVRAYPLNLRPLFRPSVEPFLRSELALDPAALLAGLKPPVTIVQGETDLQITVA